MMQPYSEPIVESMQQFYEQLSEKDRRLYLGVEAKKLAWGGQSYLAALFGCSPKTIRRGLDELAHPEKLPKPGRIRQPGGGRKRLLTTHADLDPAIEQVVEDYTAGDPMRAERRWTNLTPPQIAAKLSQTAGVSTSPYVVKQWLKKHRYVKRKAQKKVRLGDCAQRNDQFETIRHLKEQYRADGCPLISIDTKKKELIGNLYRAGHLYTQETLTVFDHDYPYLAEGIAIPYTIYDLQQNQAYVYLGTSKDTAEFVADCLRQWWTDYGRWAYPTATSILVLADGGGSNSARHYIFKAELQQLADALQVEIRLAHYPPYCSKWNPVEHRVFPHLTRTMQGVILTSHTLMKTLLERATTKTGLRVVVQIVDKVYLTGRKVAADFKDTMRIVFDEQLPQWNYRAIPFSP